jgi:hypothetical protein
MKGNKNDKIIIPYPYGTDLTNYNKNTFRHCVIEQAAINNICSNLFQTITTNHRYSTTIKTLLDSNIYPKSTNIAYYLLLFIGGYIRYLDQ